MKVLRRHKSDYMKNIVECPECRGEEYYGMTVMRDGRSYCRNCIYELWQREGYEAAKHREEVEAARQHRKPLFERLSFWRPTSKDLTYPLYEDGIDYSREEENYEKEESEQSLL